MIRASGLYGRSVVDLDTAERVGAVDEIIVDPYAPGVAGYVVASDRSFFRRQTRTIVPLDAIHAIGPDALTMRSVGRSDEQAVYLDALPRLSELTGRRMVSFGGKLLGTVEDALVDERTGRIIGYPLERQGPGTWLDSVFGVGWKLERPDYVRADAALRVGTRLIVVPDDAVASGAELDELPPADGRADRPALAPAPDPDTAPSVTPSRRAAEARTRPFAMDELLGADDRDGQAIAEDGRADDPGERDWSSVDHDGDTGGLADGAGGRPPRRPQAERMR
jgi:sporulation protein YlmC with PRC-barrel domain